ncbi:hypothetical protein [Clostridium merdae]|uniref:hypothetical protein n=1 Tax=Clostridium merdae TaxID=1958780 RepID=UPI000A267FF5|nr:hypothetical protein [Clostridium merdae]
MREGYVLKSAEAAISEQELECISRYTRREFSPEELYVFSVVLCDNEVDRDFERFTISALERLGKLFLGKTGLFDHSMKSGDQTARIFSTHIETDAQKKTQAGEAYTRLVARAYLPKSKKNSDLILELESGIKKEVSVGCAVGKARCSICGADRKSQTCTHVKGHSYDNSICCTVLDEPTDAYEWSFVAVPAQRQAGVIKGFLPEREGELGMEHIQKALQSGQGVTLTSEQAGVLSKHIVELKALAESGRQYRESVSKSIVRLCALNQSGIPCDVMSRAVKNLELDDLILLEKSLKQKATDAMPMRPQLMREAVAEEAGRNDVFRI